ncbi:fibrinogen-like protein 1 [Dysidea avara]|uniref:fibrinogen-like protein 1 n=1 Tax=Dysidea avara TaxID=196820 RepID=UPI0033176C28
MTTLHIILISLFTTGITATPYCDQQLKQLQVAANNLKQKCTINNTTISTCCDLNAFYFFTKPSGVYQMDCWCGGKWNIANVYCDTTTANGGWTVIQRRKDGSENFNRSWVDYEKGFGDLDGEFWYGLKAMNCLTETGQWELRVDFEFPNKTRSYLHYNLFRVGSASEEYPLTIGGFTSITLTDPFSTMVHNGQRFTTYDNDNDKIRGNCAVQRDNAKDNGGWWYTNCWNINLNLQYNPGEYGSLYLNHKWHNPRWIEMKIRPLNCIPQ